MANCRVFAVPIVETGDESAYIKIEHNGTIEDATALKLYDKKLETEVQEFEAIAFSFEATDGESNYSSSLITKETLIDNRVRSSNAIKILGEDSTYVNFILKFLLFGTYDTESEFKLVVTRNDGLELSIVKEEPGSSFAIKLLGFHLPKDGLIKVDLFEWFNVLSLQNVSVVHLLQNHLESNKKLEKKVEILERDNDVVLKNYERIRSSTDEFVKLLNLKKLRIAELEQQLDIDQDITAHLNYNKRRMEMYDPTRNDSIYLPKKEETDEQHMEDVPKRKKLKKEDSEVKLADEPTVETNEKFPNIKQELKSSLPSSPVTKSELKDETTSQEEEFVEDTEEDLSATDYSTED